MPHQKLLGLLYSHKQQQAPGIRRGKGWSENTLSVRKVLCSVGCFIYLLFLSYTLKKTVTIKSQAVLSHTFNSST